MPPPKIKILPSFKTKKARNPSLSKMALDTTRPLNERDLLDELLSDGSADSDETIIRSELRKQQEDPFVTENQLVSEDDDDTSFRSSYDGNGPRNVREEGDLGDDEQSNPSSQTSDGPSDNNQGKVSPPEVSPKVIDQPSVDVGKDSVAESSSGTHHQIVSASHKTEVAVDVAGVSREARMEIEKNLLKRIKEAERLKKILDKELKKRKRVLSQKVNPEKSQSTSQNGPGPTSSQTQLQPSAAGTSSTTVMAKIPKLLLNSGIIKSALERVSRRKRLANSYSLLSEILAVKQILARGNPFKVIPQQAYDISKVPGIRLPHIQQLIKQWEAYFAKMLYQIVQIEYSLEYIDVERRIALMIEGGDNYDTLFEFQSFVGKDEVTLRKNIQGTSQKEVSKEEEPLSKKTKKGSELVNEGVEVAGAAGSSVKNRPPSSSFTYKNT